MKKLLLALAVVGATGSPALAQTSFTLYGVADAGIAHDRDNVTGGGNRTSLDSGIQAGSRVGFRGTHDLGKSYSGIFTLEMGLSLDTGTTTQGATFGRQAYVGVESDWGRLTLGRQYAPYYLVLSEVADPFGGGLAGNAGNLMWDAGTRMNNTIVFALPDWRGFNAQLAYGFGETSGSNKTGRSYSGSIGYATGPIAVKMAHHSASHRITAVRSRSTMIAGTYDLNMAQIHLGVADNDNVADSNGAVREADSRDWLTGISIPFSQSNVILSYIRKNDRTALNRDASQWAVGYTYNFTKQTNLYTSYGRISNSNGATYTVGNAMNAGIGEQHFNIGIRHIF